jgi:hypothetical protein
MIKQVVECDECGKQTPVEGAKAWWMVRSNGAFDVLPWDENDKTEQPRLHSCSNACVIQMTQKWMSGQKEAAEADKGRA